MAVMKGKKTNQTYLEPREKANLQVLKEMLDLDQSEVVALGLQLLMETPRAALENRFTPGVTKGRLIRDYDPQTGHVKLPNMATRSSP